jgi:hypothetical protein
MLWRPIAKLMRRVQELRASRVVTTPPTNASLSSNGSLHTTESTGLTNPELFMMDNSQDWFSDLNSSFALGEEASRATYDDAQLNWSTFMDYVNMDYVNMECTTDFTNGLF